MGIDLVIDDNVIVEIKAVSESCPRYLSIKYFLI